MMMDCVGREGLSLDEASSLEPPAADMSLDEASSSIEEKA